LIGGNGKRSLRRPKLSTRKFSAWKKKKKRTYVQQIYFKRKVKKIIKAIEDT